MLARRLFLQIQIKQLMFSLLLVLLLLLLRLPVRTIWGGLELDFRSIAVVLVQLWFFYDSLIHTRADRKEAVGVMKQGVLHIHLKHNTRINTNARIFLFLLNFDGPFVQPKKVKNEEEGCQQAGFHKLPVWRERAHALSVQQTQRCPNGSSPPSLATHTALSERKYTAFSPDCHSLGKEQRAGPRGNKATRRAAQERERKRAGWTESRKGEFTSVLLWNFCFDKYESGKFQIHLVNFPHSFFFPQMGELLLHNQ